MGARHLVSAMMVVLCLHGADQAVATPWQKHLVAGMTALSNNRVDAAERSFRRCLPYLERRNVDSELLFDDFAAIAVAYISLQRYDRAAEWARRSLDGMERLRGPVHFDLVQPLFVVATICAAEKKFDEAAPLLERAFRVSWQCGEQPGEQHLHLARLVVTALTASNQQDLARRLVDAAKGKPVDAAAPNEGPTADDTPEEVKRYERAKQTVIQQATAFNHLVNWFERHADPKLLKRSEYLRNKIRAEARDRWNELLPLMVHIFDAEKALRYAVRVDSIASTTADADQRWFAELSATVLRAESNHSTIMGEQRPRRR